MFDFLSSQFSAAFSRLTGQNKLTEQNIDETLTQVKDSLLEADVPYQVVHTFIDDVKKQVIGQKVIGSLRPGQQFIKVVHDELKKFLQPSTYHAFDSKTKGIVLVMGLQGSGKTTTVAKLAGRLKKLNPKKKVLVGSVDFYRPAAIDQLEILAKQVGVDFYRPATAQPIEAAQELVTRYRQGGYDILFVDTAGRLHIDQAMIKELESIDAMINPQHKLLILDAMTGQESLAVAKLFNEVVGFDAAILTKMDSDTRGGAAFAFSYSLQKPIVFVGIGEKIDNLEPFYPDRAASRILGMGDIQTLLERAEESIKKEEQEKLAHSFMNGNMTLNDFAQQMEMMNRLGSLSTLVKFLPGGQGGISQDQLEQGEQQLKKFKAIISSMTPKERLHHAILNDSRKKRIAAGAGVGVQEINNLLQKFEQSKQFVKLFKKMGRFSGGFPGF